MGKWFQNKSFSTEKQEQGIKVRKGHRGINARKMHRALGILLAAALVFQTVPFEGIAVSASESSGGGLCEHHRSHTPACGYKEAEPGHGCTHEHTEDCYRTVEGEDGSTTKELDCHHEHDESCGYREAAEGSPCTFVCEICSGGTDKIPEDKTDGNEINDGGSENQGTENGNETEEPGDGQEECICEERCTEDSINTDCPVCGAEDASLSDCKGKDTEDSTEDVEENTDQPEDTGLCKHHREHDDTCGYLPESEDSEGSSCTYECRVCPIEKLIAALPDKVTEDNADNVRAQLDHILALYGELTGEEQEQIDLSRCYVLQEALDGANDPDPVADSVDYREASWNNSEVVYADKTATCTSVESSADVVTWNAGWYAVSGTVTIAEPITVSGDVNLILADGCTLNASQGIVVTTNNSLTIYAQTSGTGTLNATGTTDSNENASAGIGGGTDSRDSGSIAIHGGVINATGGYVNNSGGSGAGIGGGGSGSIDGDGGNSGAITIFDGVITAVGGELDYVNQIAAYHSGAGIGGGSSRNNSGGAGNTITIYGGTVTAKSQAYNNSGAGIGGGGAERKGGAGNTIAIYGGKVTATSDTGDGTGGAGIGGGGGGDGGSGDGTATISGGTVTAVGRDYAAGIGGGGGYQGSYGANISGGTGNVSITGGIVDASSPTDVSWEGYAGAPIGNGGNASGTATVNKTNGIVFENGVGTVCGDVTFDGSYEVPADYSLHIPAGASLSGSGTLSGGGRFTAELSEDMISVPTNLYYDGTDRTAKLQSDLSAELNKGIEICGQPFTVSGWTVAVEKTGDLTYTATYTNENDGSKKFTKTITLQQSGTTLDGAVETYKDGVVCSDFTASDTITVKATPTATGQAPTKAAACLRGDPAAGQMAVYVGTTQVSAPVSAVDGTYTMTVSAADVLTNGQAGQDNKYTLIVRFVENTNMAGAEAQAEVTITPNPLTADMVTLSEESATYDGTEQQPNITVAGLTAGTDYDVTFQAGFKNAGTYTVTITGKGIYAGTVKKIFTIEKATPTVAWENNELELTYTGQPADIEPTVTLVNSETFSGTITYTYGVYSGPDRPTNAASYNVKASIPEQDNYTAAESDWLILCINPADQAAPAAPTAAEGNIKDTSITLDTIENAEYSKDGTNWQESPEFTELSPNTQYTFYARLKADRNHNASSSSAAASITTKKTMLDNATVLVNGTYTYTGAAIVPETGNVTVELNGTTINSDQYTISATDNINAGEATVTVTAAANGNYSGSISTTFTIEKAEQTDFAFAAVTKPYEKNGTFTLAAAGGGGNGAVLYRVPENNGVLMVNGDQATIIGVGTVTVTATKAESENYKAATATGTIRITKAPAPAITYPAVGSITYGQKLSDCALTGGSTEYGTFAWENGSTIPAVDNTGYTVVFTASEETKKNYETITNTTKSVSVKVEKAVPAVSVTAAVSGSKDNRQAVITVNVAKAGAGAFPTGTVTFIDCTGSKVKIGTATLSNGSASYTWDGLRDKTYTIKAFYTGNDNYKEAESRELTFDAAKQNQQDFSLDAIGAKTYGDAAIPLKTTGGSGNGAVRYESSDEDVIRIEGGRAVIAGAGTATITAIKEGDSNYNEASATRNVTVAKKALTVRADSKTVAKGYSMPSFTWQAAGLVNGDTFTAAPSITADVQNTDTLGKYDIVINGGTLRNSGSYSITYVNGTLHIVERFYTVTVTDGTGSGEYAEGDTVTVTADERNGYTFTGWSSEYGVAFADSKAKTTTFTMPAKSVTVKANYTRNSSGGNNGGGSGDDGNNGGGGSTTPQISVKLPVQNTNPGNEATPGPEITSVNPGTGDTSRPGIASVNPGIGDTSRPGTTPVNPGIGNTARPGTRPCSGSAGTPAQGTKQPFIKGADGKIGWDVIRAEEENAEEGSVINVDMNGSTVVPGDLFDSIKGKDITITFDMGNGILWSVDGKSITTDKAGDIDFSVKSGVKTVPVDIINNVTGKSYSIQISLAYEGEFGFTAVLSINLGKENAGCTASLYYYNESTGELEFICSDEVAQDGTVSLAFTHASDYVIAIDGDGEEGDGAAEPVQPDNTVQAAGNGTAQDSDGIPESPGTVQTGRAWWMIAILLFIAVIGAGIAIAVVREKRKGGRNNSWRNSM